MYGAKRFGADLSRFPTIVAIVERLSKLPAFAAADADAQPDAT